MDKTAPTIIAYLIGQAVIRSLYLKKDHLSSVAILKTSDLALGISTVTKILEKKVGDGLKPDQVIVCAAPQDLEALKGLVEATFVPEAKAISAAEKYLSAKLGSPTAILDLGPSAFREHFPAEDVARWLPFVANLTDIENYLANKRLFPWSMPTTAHEYEIDLAVARQSIIKLGEKDNLDYFTVGGEINLIMTGGLLTSITKVADLISIVLDSFYFQKSARLVSDHGNLLVMLGSVLAEYPDLEIDYGPQMTQIGSVLHLTGPQQITVDFGLQEKQRLSLNSGEIVKLPVGEGGIATVKVGEKDSTEYQLLGGDGGIYFDNRDRPLGVVAGSKDSIGRILSWRKALSDEQLVEEPVA